MIGIQFKQRDWQEGEKKKIKDIADDGEFW